MRSGIQSGAEHAALVSDAGRAPSEQAAVREHGAADRRAGSGDRIEGGDGSGEMMRQRRVMTGEVFVEWIETTEFPGFGFSRQGQWALGGAKMRLQKNVRPSEGSRVGTILYACQKSGAIMEISA